MLRLMKLVVFALLFALAACGRPTATVSEPTPAPEHIVTTAAPAPVSAAHRTFGEAISERNVTALDELLTKPATFTDKTVRTEGKITAVCQAMGCWMEIGDERGLAHVKMAGHSFFIPKDTSGKHAVVQGKVLAGAKDGCSEEAEHATGEVAKVEIEATGVEIVD